MNFENGADMYSFLQNDSKMCFWRLCKYPLYILDCIIITNENVCVECSDASGVRPVVCPNNCPVMNVVFNINTEYLKMYLF